MTPPPFEILAPRYDKATATARFAYRIGTLAFTETVRFPGLEGDIAASRQPAFDHLLDIAAATLGVSYYKLLAPFDILAPDLALTATDRELLHELYENGLGEFFARNDLKRFGRLDFSTGTREDSQARAPSLSAGALVLVGGGKDSLVSLALLEDAGVPLTLFAVNPKGPIAASAERADLPLRTALRTLDPEMLSLSREPGYYNGHVPSTAINSIIAALAALLSGHDRIVLSNERSASEGNLAFDGRIANHQYSKSLDFERVLARTLAEATGDALAYFSLLRPYSEARIAALFARTTRFDDVFSSCNRNFTQIPHQGPLWCGKCPKCHFVALILAPQMDRARLVSIQGMDVLDDADNLPAFRELTGLSGHKPWECVGEILEAAACLWRIAHQDQWRDAAVVKALAPELETFYGRARLNTAYDELMADSADHLIPPDLAARVATGAEPAHRQS